MTLDKAVDIWIDTHDTECESCGKLFTNEDVVVSVENEGSVDILLQCGWCWERAHAGFVLNMS